MKSTFGSLIICIIFINGILYAQEDQGLYELTASKTEINYKETVDLTFKVKHPFEEPHKVYILIPTVDRDYYEVIGQDKWEFTLNPGIIKEIKFTIKPVFPLNVVSVRVSTAFKKFRDDGIGSSVKINIKDAEKYKIKKIRKEGEILIDGIKIDSFNIIEQDTLRKVDYFGNYNSIKQADSKVKPSSSETRIIHNVNTKDKSRKGKSGDLLNKSSF